MAMTFSVDRAIDIIKSRFESPEVYPCHVSPRDMRQRPIGTGPFKLVEFKPNESIKLARNPITGSLASPISTGWSIRSSATSRRRS